jgi:recombination protein U
MKLDNQIKALRQYRGAQNNAQGHYFESYIKTACIIYQQQGRAEIEKTPEPFQVLKKHPDGTFTGRFTRSKAQPDFGGTLSGGRSIYFEAKYTITEKMNRNVLTDEQMKRLEAHEKMGALARVCVGIQDQFFFLPWGVWREMKKIYGRQYITAADIEQYRVKFTGAIMFLDYIHPSER